MKYRAGVIIAPVLTCHLRVQANADAQGCRDTVSDLQTRCTLKKTGPHASRATNQTEFTYHPQSRIRVIDLRTSRDSISDSFSKGMRWRREKLKPSAHLDVGGEGEEHRHEHVAAPPDEAEQRP